MRARTAGGLLLAGMLALGMVCGGCDDASSDRGAAAQGAADGGMAAAPGRGGGAGGVDGSGAGGSGDWEGAPAQDAGVGYGGMDGGSGGGGGGNTNINLGGAQDFGYFRRLVEDGIVPTSEDFEAAGFFAEHHTPLPEPECGERICVQAMLGVMGNLINGNNCTLLQIGLNSPLVARPDQRPPLTLAVVVDISGSMRAEGKLDFVRQGLGQMINALDDDDQMALVLYSSESRVAFPMAELHGRRNELQRLVNGLSAEGGTNLYAGLEMGYQEVLAHYDSGRQNRVILLSDGEPTAGNTDPAAILALSRAYNSDGVGLTTVGLGTSFNYQLMRDLAELGDGNFYFLEDAGAVEEVFTQELSYFTVPVAFELELQVRAGQHYRFGRAYGSRFWEDTEDGGRLEVPSVFLAHRVSHDDVEPGGGRRGGGSALLLELMPTVEEGEADLLESDVAEIDFRFREPGTDRIVRDTVQVRYPHAPWIMRREGFFDNPIVEKSFVMLNIFVGLQTACDLHHFERDSNQAIAVLQRLIAAVADYEDSANDGEGDVDMQLDIELIEQLINAIRANGGQDPEGNDIPEDPWPAD